MTVSPAVESAPPGPSPSAFPAGTSSAGRRAVRMPIDVFLCRGLSWLSWRYRYLIVFTLIGFLSICFEVLVVSGLSRIIGESRFLNIGGFALGMLMAFWLNFRFNFRVERARFWRVLTIFAVISIASFSLQIYATATLHVLKWSDYPFGRFVTAGGFFLIAYLVHRRLSFRRAAKNLGIAVYATAGVRPQELYDRIGEHCDHLHIDLVDETMKTDADPVDISVIAEARRLWRWQPCMIHLMTRVPTRWLPQVMPLVDAVLVHVDGDDEIFSVLAELRANGKGCGVVLHPPVGLDRLLPYLPHVDYVLVLGIAQPGMSGQLIRPEAIASAQVLDELAERYGFELIFDGGVTVENVQHIPATYIVSSSTVLRAEDPLRAALTLRSGLDYGRRG